MRVALALVVLTQVVGPAPSLAPSDPAAVGALLRDVQGRDFDRAHAAAEKLRRYPAHRAQIVPALIQAMATREWDRCSADARDAIARTLGDLKAREAVTPLLDLITTDTPIAHECFE